MRLPTLLWLILTLGVYIYTLPDWITMAGMSLIVIDGPINLAAVTFLFCVWGYPIFLLLCEIYAWRNFSNEIYLQAFFLGTLPLLVIIFAWGYAFGFNTQFWTWPLSIFS